MNGIRAEAESAINAFIEAQKEVDGTASFLLVDFDAQEPFRVVYDGDLAALEAAADAAWAELVPGA